MFHLIEKGNISKFDFRGDSFGLEHNGRDRITTTEWFKATVTQLDTEGCVGHPENSLVVCHQLR